MRVLTPKPIDRYALKLFMTSLSRLSRRMILFASFLLIFPSLAYAVNTNTDERWSLVSDSTLRPSTLIVIDGGINSKAQLIDSWFGNDGILDLAECPVNSITADLTGLNNAGGTFDTGTSSENILAITLSVLTTTGDPANTSITTNSGLRRVQNNTPQTGDTSSVTFTAERPSICRVPTDSDLLLAIRSQSPTLDKVEE